MVGQAATNRDEVSRRENNLDFLPTVTAATTGDTITDNVTPPAMTRFLLCLEMSLPS